MEEEYQPSSGMMINALIQIEEYDKAKKLYATLTAKQKKAITKEWAEAELWLKDFSARFLASSVPDSVNIVRAQVLPTPTYQPIKQLDQQT